MDSKGKRVGFRTVQCGDASRASKVGSIKVDASGPAEVGTIMVDAAGSSASGATKVDVAQGSLRDSRGGEGTG